MAEENAKHPSTLKDLLQQSGFDPLVWEPKFYKYDVTEPQQLATIEQDFAVYNELASNASEDEKVGLQKLLSIDLPTEKDISVSMNEELESKLQHSGFDTSYWLTIFGNVLGIRSP